MSTTMKPEAPVRREPKHVPPELEKKGSGWVSLVLGVLLLAGLGWGGWWYYTNKDKPTGPAGGGRGAGRGKMDEKPVPVKATVTKRGNLPIYLNGVGNAAAFNSVLLRSRVDGQLVDIKFKDGEKVKKDQLLAVIDSKPFEAALQQMKAQKVRDVALRDNAQRDLERYQRAREAVPQQLIDTAASQVAQYNAAIEADEAQIKNAEVQLAYTQIRSPIDGTAGIRNVDVGNIIHASDPSGLVTITQLQPISVYFTLSQGNLGAVQKAMRANAEKRVPVYAYDAFMKMRIASGVLETIDNQIDPQTLTFRLKARFENEDESLYPNQSLNIRMLADTRKDVVLAPGVAIQESPNSAFVYVVNADNSVVMRPVVTGPSEGGLTVIDRGLQADETIVTDGVDNLHEGSKVAVSTDEPRPEQPATRGGHRAAATKKAGGEE